MDKQVEKIDSEYKAKRKEKWQELKQEPNGRVCNKEEI